MSASLEKAFPEYKSSGLDDSYSDNWVMQHNHIAEHNGNTLLMYFSEVENIGSQCLFQTYVGPLVLRGLFKGNQLDVEIGFAPNHVAFHTLSHASGNLSEGQVVTSFSDAQYYQGDITFSLSDRDLLATVKFGGLGADIVNAKIQIISG